MATVRPEQSWISTQDREYINTNVETITVVVVVEANVRALPHLT